MSDGIVYTSADDEVLRVWTEHEAAHFEFNERRKAVMAKYDRVLMAHRGWDSGVRVDGFSPREGENTDRDLLATQGLREDKNGTLVPRASTSLGKQLATELAALDEPGIKLPGMPQFFIGPGLRVYAPAMFRHVDKIWLHWPSAPDSGVDEEIWTERPLSHFYTAKENKAALEEASA